ncbi:hypothetical protein B0H16DRAFT_1892545 [Mycena metata]|uniref:Uncharacterized protein n=1 Tax=Mycena metata TaxID=1033252 RepID=A0AAD7I3M4_9AGAR|nr:hypothetical protein B0H16DRAFT_1892545 [Mycena metata]
MAMRGHAWPLGFCPITPVIHVRLDAATKQIHTTPSALIHHWSEESRLAAILCAPPSSPTTGTVSKLPRFLQSPAQRDRSKSLSVDRLATARPALHPLPPPHRFVLFEFEREWGFAGTSYGVARELGVGIELWVRVQRGVGVVRERAIRRHSSKHHLHNMGKKEMVLPPPFPPSQCLERHPMLDERYRVGMSAADGTEFASALGGLGLYLFSAFGPARSHSSASTGRSGGGGYFPKRKADDFRAFFFFLAFVRVECAGVSRVRPPHPRSCAFLRVVCVRLQYRTFALAQLFHFFDLISCISADYGARALGPSPPCACCGASSAHWHLPPPMWIFFLFFSSFGQGSAGGGFGPRRPRAVVRMGLSPFTTTEIGCPPVGSVNLFPSDGELDVRDKAERRGEAGGFGVVRVGDVVRVGLRPSGRWFVRVWGAGTRARSYIGGDSEFVRLGWGRAGEAG